LKKGRSIPPDEQLILKGESRARAAESAGDGRQQQEPEAGDSSRRWATAAGAGGGRQQQEAALSILQ
jgi:hypothetical protein